MSKKIILFVLAGFVCLVTSGCVVRTYKVTKDRTDQDLTSGNRGSIMGEADVVEQESRRATRQHRVVEVEFHPIQWLTGSGEVEPTSGSVAEAKAQTSEAKSTVTGQVAVVESKESLGEVQMQKYTVMPNDTLQRISQKFYGTTKSWKKIFQANSKILKTPDSIYPGQIINVPVVTKGSGKK